MTHKCVSKLTIIGSDSGLSSSRRQAIIWTNAGILLIWTLRRNFSEIVIVIPIFSFKKMHLKISSGKWWPFCIGLNLLTAIILLTRSIHWAFYVESSCPSDKSFPWSFEIVSNLSCGEHQSNFCVKITVDPEINNTGEICNSLLVPKPIA